MCSHETGPARGLAGALEVGDHTGESQASCYLADGFASLLLTVDFIFNTPPGLSWKVLYKGPVRSDLE